MYSSWAAWINTSLACGAPTPDEALRQNIHPRLEAPCLREENNFGLEFGTHPERPGIKAPTIPAVGRT